MRLGAGSVMGPLWDGGGSHLVTADHFRGISSSGKPCRKGGLIRPKCYSRAGGNPVTIRIPLLQRRASVVSIGKHTRQLELGRGEKPIRLGIALLDQGAGGRLPLCGNFLRPARIVVRPKDRGRDPVRNTPSLGIRNRSFRRCSDTTHLPDIGSECPRNAHPEQHPSPLPNASQVPPQISPDRHWPNQHAAPDAAPPPRTHQSVCGCPDGTPGGFHRPANPDS